MEKNEALKKLRSILLPLYAEVSDIRRIAHDAGVNQSEIDWQGPSINIWLSVLTRAVKENRLSNLIECAVDEYSSEADDLNHAYKLWEKAAADIPESSVTQQHLDGNKMSETDQKQTSIRSEGGTVVNGNVYICGGDFVGRDKKAEASTQNQEDTTATPKTVKPYDLEALKTIPLSWPSLWNSPRPDDFGDVEEWVRMARLQFNPFGPEYAESDPELEKVHVQPSAVKRYWLNAKSVVVFGVPGSGKTTSCYLVANGCRRRVPTARAFPVICIYNSGTATATTMDAVEHFLIECLARALVDFIAVNPAQFLQTDSDHKIAIVACFLHTFVSFEGIKAQLTLKGLTNSDDSATNWLLSELDELARQVDQTTFTSRDWITVISKARPSKFLRTFFILDVRDLIVSALATDIAFLQLFLRYVVSPDLKAVYLKAFLPDVMHPSLQVPNHVSSDHLAWTVAELTKMLESRFVGESGFIVHLNQLFDAETRLTNPAHRLALAANGNPRRLIQLGNNLLIEHVSRQPVQFELTEQDLSRILR